MTDQSHRGGEQTFRSARIFDGTGPGGRPHVDRKMLDEGEAGRVLAYLEAAPVVHAADDYGHDRIDPGRGRSVPLTWQTDGSWVWPGAVSHYLRCYALPPDPEFLAHIRKRGFQLPAVPSEVRQAALAAVSSGPPDGMARRPAPPPAGRFGPRVGPAGPAGPAALADLGPAGPAGRVSPLGPAGPAGPAGPVGPAPAPGTPGPATAVPASAGPGGGPGPRPAAGGPPAGRNGLTAPPSGPAAGAGPNAMSFATPPGSSGPGPHPAPLPHGPAGNGSPGVPTAQPDTVRYGAGPDGGGAGRNALPDPGIVAGHTRSTVGLGASAVANGSAAAGAIGAPSASGNGSRPPANGSGPAERSGGPVRAIGSRDAEARDAAHPAPEPASRGFSTIAAALDDLMAPAAASAPSATARPTAAASGSRDREPTPATAEQAAAGARTAAGSRNAGSRPAASTPPGPDGGPVEVGARRPGSVFVPATTPAAQPAPLRTPGGSTAAPATPPPAAQPLEAMVTATVGAGGPPATPAVTGSSPRKAAVAADRGAAPGSTAGLFGPAPAVTPPAPGSGIASPPARPAPGGSQHSHSPRAGLGHRASGGPPGDRAAGGRVLGEPWSGRAGTPHGDAEPSSRSPRTAGSPPHAAPTRSSGRGVAYRAGAAAPAGPNPADDSSSFDRLRAAAVGLGLSTRAYRVGAAAEGSWSVLREDSGWAVFRTERGVRHELATFPNSLQAAAYLIGQLCLARDAAGTGSQATAPSAARSRTARAADAPRAGISGAARPAQAVVAQPDRVMSAAAPARRVPTGPDQVSDVDDEPRRRLGADAGSRLADADAGSSGDSPDDALGTRAAAPAPPSESDAAEDHTPGAPPAASRSAARTDRTEVPASSGHPTAAGSVADAPRLGRPSAGLDASAYPTRTGSVAGSSVAGAEPPDALAATPDPQATPSGQPDSRRTDDATREPVSAGGGSARVTASSATTDPERHVAGRSALTGAAPGPAGKPAGGHRDAFGSLVSTTKPPMAAGLGQEPPAGDDGGASPLKTSDKPAAPGLSSQPTGRRATPLEPIAAVAEGDASREPDVASASATAGDRPTGASEPVSRPGAGTASADPTPDNARPVTAFPVGLVAGAATALPGSTPSRPDPARSATRRAVSLAADPVETPEGSAQAPPAAAASARTSAADSHTPPASRRAAPASSPASRPAPAVGGRPAPAADQPPSAAARPTGGPATAGRRTAAPAAPSAGPHAAADQHAWARPAAAPAVRPPASTSPDASQAGRPARRSASDPTGSAAASQPNTGAPRAQASLRDGAEGGAPDSAQQPPAARRIQPLPGEPPLTLYRDKRVVLLPAGTELDRFGDSSGNVTYAARTPYAQRSLPVDWNDLTYHAYRLRRPLEALTGHAVPWFEQPGGGQAFVLTSSVADLVAEGSLVEVEGAAPPG